LNIDTVFEIIRNMKIVPKYGANFFQWWHREGPIGSGEPAAQASTLGYVAVFAFGWALFGVCLIF